MPNLKKLKKQTVALNWLHLPNQNQFKQISPNAFNLTRRSEIFMIKKIIIQNLVDLSLEQSYDYNYVPKIYLVSVKLYCQIKVHQHKTFLVYHITSPKHDPSNGLHMHKLLQAII